MTKKEFNNYRFSINTEINYLADFWDKVTEVDFQNAWVGIKRGQIVKYNEIKNIREVPTP